MHRLLTSILLFTAFSVSSQELIYILDGEVIVDSAVVYSVDIDSNGSLYSRISYYDSLQTKLAAVKYYRNRKQNGVFKTYFPEGSLMEFGVYGNGIRHGEYTIYNKDGSIAVKGKFKDGKKHGYWAYKNDDCFGRYKRGKKTGTWKCYVNFEEIKTHY